MMVVCRRQFRVRVFSPGEVDSYVDKEIEALTDVFAVVLVLQSCGIQSAYAVSVAREGGAERWWYGVTVVGLSLEWWGVSKL